MPLDMGNLQYKVPVLKSIYLKEGISDQLKSFLDLSFEKETKICKMQVHPFISLKGKNSTNDTSELSEEGKSQYFRITTNKPVILAPLKDSIIEAKSSFTFGSGARNSRSSNTSESNYFPAEFKRFLTKGSALESSSGGVESGSQMTSIDYFNMHRFSGVSGNNQLPTYSPAIPLRSQDRSIIKPIFLPMEPANDSEK